VTKAVPSAPYLRLRADFLPIFLRHKSLSDPKLLATHASKAGAIAFLGMAFPFALGIGISQTMFDVLQVGILSFLPCLTANF
jgi:hypothetical protein